MRWLTLVNIVLLFSFKTRPESPYVFTFAVLYCLLLTLFWRKLTKLLNRYFALLALDITISGILMGLIAAAVGQALIFSMRLQVFLLLHTIPAA